MVRSTAVAVALCLAVSNAQAVIMDFDASPGGTFLFAPYQEDGFQITVQQNHYDIWNNCGYPGGCLSNFLVVDDGGFGDTLLRLTKVGGGPFDLVSLDVVQASAYDASVSQSSMPCGVFCTVTSSNGGSASFPMQGAMAFSGADWTQVSWVEFFAAGVSATHPFAHASAWLDNINVVAIPLPSAAALFGSALGVILFGRPRRKRL